MKNSFAPRRAFTLIEILVVIAIIGILSAVLFPVLAKARENARKTACLSNLKQLGVAFQQYTADTGGKYPLAGNFQAWAPGNAHWVAGTAGSSTVSIDPGLPPFPFPNPTFAGAADVKGGALFPYVKETGVYVCPSAEFGRQIGLSYSMNCALSGLGSNGKMRAATDIVLLVDERYPTDGFFFARDGCKAGDCSTDALQDRHNGGGNLLFADGHVKFFLNDRYALDNSPKGFENKAALTGSPRFHDRAFGSKGGSSLLPVQTAPGVFPATPTVDSCAAPLT